MRMSVDRWSSAMQMAAMEKKGFRVTSFCCTLEGSLEEAFPTRLLFFFTDAERKERDHQFMFAGRLATDDD